MKKTHGFTLIELMITVVVVAIIAAIAVPSYQQYIERKDLAIARQEALRIAAELERFKAKNFSYKGFDAGYLYGAHAGTDDDGNPTSTNYYDNTKGELVLPLGASKAEEKFILTLWDAVEQRPLTSADVAADEAAGIKASTVNGLGWIIFVERAMASSDQPKQPRNYDLLLTSGGIRCMTQVKGSIKENKFKNCGDNSESW